MRNVLFASLLLTCAWGYSPKEETLRFVTVEQSPYLGQRPLFQQGIRQPHQFAHIQGTLGNVCGFELQTGQEPGVQCNGSEPSEPAWCKRFHIRS